jgi:hypothetical protein
MYESGPEWRGATARRVMLFGMSGLGKTWLAKMLRERAQWFHYSVDYRIGTRYMGEHIADSFKLEAMKVPLLRELLLGDSVHIRSNITFDNLAPLATYLGKPGDPDKGGLPIAEYRRRQALHHDAEIAAMVDTPHFIARAQSLYGYDNFVCDSSGSICEIVDPENPVDPVLSILSRHVLFVWIEGTEAHTEELIRRFDRAPKPMYYRPEFLTDAWTSYLAQHEMTPDRVDPDAFVRWTYARALAHRQPRYRAMARRGITLRAADVAALRSPAEFEALVAQALDARIKAAE